MRFTAILVVSVVAGVTLAGCVTSDPLAEAPVSSPGAVTESSALPSHTPIDTVDAQLEALVALPAGIDPTSDAALAWEALMSADGEYAAAASYQAVLDAFGTVEPYATILEGELRHIDALTRQLERSGVTVPANPYLGVLTAPADLQTAAEAWAEGEVLNVAMYDALIAQADDARLVNVLENLRRASLESHLPLFEAAAAAGGTLDTLPAHTP